jgi:Protein of unknown function (DUF3108)
MSAAARPPRAASASAPAGRRRAAPLAALVLAVLLAHAWLLRAVTLGVGNDPARPGVHRIELRRIPPPAAPSPAAEAPTVAASPATPAAPPEPAEPPPRPPPAATAAMAAANLPPPPPRFTPTPDPPRADDEPAPAPAATEPTQGDQAAPAAAEPPPDGGGALPQYPTRPPPPALLRYELRRGSAVVPGSPSWRHDNERYELELEASLFGSPLIEQRSQGGFDTAGLAPLRFADRRRGRDLRAANFQRDKGLITYSGPQVQYPLVPGAQDRLSWMVQLPAIAAAAAPGALAEGTRISMFVTGSAGDGDVWTFTVTGRETLALPRGATDTLRLLREPRRDYDSQVEVWLAPALGFWPVRARLGTPADPAAAMELILQDGPLPP